MKKIIAEHDFNHILDFILNTTGITLPETNYNVLSEFLNERMQLMHIGILDYIKKLKADKDEHRLFIDQVTINETYFFREEKQFKLLQSTIFPELKAKKGKKVSIWSAACSSGEEAVSLYTLASHCLEPEPGFSLLATDINPVVLEKFKTGIYRKNSFRNDGTGYHYLLDKVLTKENGNFVVSQPVISQIDIQNINLSCLPDEVTDRGFDLVFLRNAIIYFEIRQRPAIIDGIVNALAEEGYLILSSTEMPLISHPQLELVSLTNCYLFRKKNRNRKKAGQVITPQLFDTVCRQTGQIEEKSIHKKPRQKTLFAQLPAVEQRNRYNPDRILDFANQKLNNPLFELPGNSDYEAALFVVEIIYLINSHNRPKAQQLLQKSKELTGEDELFHYLTGYLALTCEDYRKAVTFFDNCLLENPLFWPARFYRATSLTRISKIKSALRDFTLCQNHIAGYIDNRLYHYQILLDGFNGKYFYTICGNWIEKLNLQGIGHGIR